MVSEDDRRLVHICVASLVVLVFTIEYAYILVMWRSPVVAYRILLGSLFAFAVVAEIEKAFGEGLLTIVPRAMVGVIALNFFVMEEFMLLARRKATKKRRIYDEHALVEDLGCEA